MTQRRAEGGELRAKTLLYVGALVALVWTGCGGGTDGGTGGSTEGDSGAGSSAVAEGVTDVVHAVYPPDWSQTRHGVSAVAATPQLSVENGPTAAEDPPRALLLYNLDDDDADGLRDVDNAVIDGDGDANDLARIHVAPLAAGTQGQVSLVLVAPGGSTGEAKDAVRIFDESGHARLGRGQGATWTLDAATLATLESQGLRLFAEGCSFNQRVELQLLVDSTVVDRVLLHVAPLLIAPAVDPIDAIFICRDDGDTNIKSIYDKFGETCGPAAQGVPPQKILDINLADDEYGHDFWIQDQLQWGYTETPFALLPIVIHMPRRSRLRLWVERQLAPDVGYVEPCPPPAAGAPAVSLAYGGNLESGIDAGVGGLGFILHGFDPGDRPVDVKSGNLLERLKQYFEESTAQPLIGIDTGWLYVGHVDEMVSLVWSPDAPGKSTLLVASPGEGVWLLEQKADDAVEEEFRKKCWSLFAAADSPDLKWKHVLEAEVPDGGASLTQFNLDLEKRIFGDPNDPSKSAGIEALLKALEAAAQAAGVEPPEMVKVPTFFTRPKSSWGTSQSSSGQAYGVDAIALLPNMLNLVSLEGRLITPCPRFGGFREALATDAEIQGEFKVDWFPVIDFLHRKGGGIHCATNARHLPPAAPKWWEAD